MPSLVTFWSGLIQVAGFWHRPTYALYHRRRLAYSCGRPFVPLMIVTPGFVAGVLVMSHYAPAGSDMVKMGIIFGSDCWVR